MDRLLKRHDFKGERDTERDGKYTQAGITVSERDLNAKGLRFTIYIEADNRKGVLPLNTAKPARKCLDIHLSIHCKH